MCSIRDDDMDVRLYGGRQKLGHRDGRYGNANRAELGLCDTDGRRQRIPSPPSTEHVAPVVHSGWRGGTITPICRSGDRDER